MQQYKPKGWPANKNKPEKKFPITFRGIDYHFSKLEIGKFARSIKKTAQLSG